MLSKTDTGMEEYDGEWPVVRLVWVAGREASCGRLRQGDTAVWA